MSPLRDLGAGVRSSLPVQVGLLLASIGVVLDQATKELAEAKLSRSEYVPWLGEHVGWQLVHNPGGAFGLPAPSWVFLLVTVLVVGIVVRTLPTTRHVLPATAYGLLLAGAVGNLLDRILRPGDDELLGGYVVDFVAWGTFPRFNVADSAITVGFVLLVLALWLEERRDGEEDASEPSTSEPSADEQGEAQGHASEDDAQGPATAAGEPAR